MIRGGFRMISIDHPEGDPNGFLVLSIHLEGAYITPGFRNSILV